MGLGISFFWVRPLPADNSLEQASLPTCDSGNRANWPPAVCLCIGSVARDALPIFHRAIVSDGGEMRIFPLPHPLPNFISYVPVFLIIAVAALLAGHHPAATRPLCFKSDFPQSRNLSRIRRQTGRSPPYLRKDRRPFGAKIPHCALKAFHRSKAKHIGTAVRNDPSPEGKQMSALNGA